MFSGLTYRKQSAGSKNCIVAHFLGSFKAVVLGGVFARNSGQSNLFLNESSVSSKGGL